MRGLVVSILFVCAGCSTLPRDPEGTLRRVRDGSIRVGLIENPPWVVRTTGEPRGAEVQLVRELAGRLESRPVWFWGGEEQHMQALERFELDLAIGGLDDRDPWIERAGATRPYYEERVLVGVRPSAAMPSSLKGLRVSAEPGGEIAGRLREKKAVLTETADAVAAPDWRLTRLGFTPTRFELLTRRHVVATPPGENAWLVEVGNFFDGQKARVAGLLEQEDRPQ